jgi:hypothetical protein
MKTDRHPRVFAAGIHMKLKQTASLRKITTVDACSGCAGMTIFTIGLVFISPLMWFNPLILSRAISKPHDVS